MLLVYKFRQKLLENKLFGSNKNTISMTTNLQRDNKSITVNITTTLQRDNKSYTVSITTTLQRDNEVIQLL